MTTSDTATIAKFGAIHVSINCAGIPAPCKVLGKDGKAIGWGDTSQGKIWLGENPLERSFRVSDLEFGDLPDAMFRRNQFTAGSLTLEKAQPRFVAVKQGEHYSVLASVRALYDEIHSKVESMVARLKLSDFAKGVTVSDDDVKRFFDDKKNKAALMVEARRKVKYVALALTDDEKKLPPSEKRQALQKIADQMEALSGAMLESGANFDKVAAGLSLTEKVKETPEFDRESITKLSEASVQGFMQAALALSPENPASDVLQGAETFHFLVLSGYTPSRALTLEEAKPQIVQILQEERGRLALDAKANEARAQIAQALTDGKSFADAAAAAGLKAEVFPAYSRTELNYEFPDSQQIIQGGLELAPGELSKPLPTGEGADLVYVVKRVPPDADKFAAAKDGLANNLRMFKQTIAARQWLYAGREAAGLRLRGNLRDLQDN
jgi:hypothetical protein